MVIKITFCVGWIISSVIICAMNYDFWPLFSYLADENCHAGSWNILVMVKKNIIYIEVFSFSQV